MEKRERAKLKRRVKTLQRRMAQLGPVMRGSVVVIGTRNKQTNLLLTQQEHKDRIDLPGKKKASKGQRVLR